MTVLPGEICLKMAPKSVLALAAISLSPGCSGTSRSARSCLRNCLLTLLRTSSAPIRHSQARSLFSPVSCSKLDIRLQKLLVVVYICAWEERNKTRALPHREAAVSQRGGTH